MTVRVDDAALSLLADVAGSHDLPAFWTRLHALLQTITPHRSAVAWHSVTVTVLGPDAEAQRARMLQSLRDHMHETGLDQPVPEAFLALSSDSLFSGAALLSALGEPPPSRLRLFAPDQLRAAADHYRRVLQPQGWEHAAILPLRGGESDGLGAGIVLYRTAEEGAFDAAQAERIEALRPILANVLAHLLEHEQQRSAQADMLDFLSELPIGLVLFDWKWRPLFVNEEGYRQTQLWNHAPAIPPRGDAKIEFRLPLALREAGNRLRQRWLEDTLGLAPVKGALSERVSHALRNDMKATLTIAQAKGGVVRLPKVLVRYSGLASRVESSLQPSPTQWSILSQLTPGERNVALLVMRGLSNQEIADALHRDITTVKDHLSHIYDKLGIRSRTQLAAALHG